jgi:hypothetical protein
MSRSFKALSVVSEFGDIDGAHHKQWVIDQMVRAITGDGYDKWVWQYNAQGGEWDEGVAP